MPVKPQSITTEADLLISLLKDVKEITFKEASKRLSIPVATLEAWATFLEEEGVVSVKYRFTTPYISLAEKDAEKKLKSEKFKGFDEKFEEQMSDVELHSELNRLQQLLGTAHRQSQSGDFPKLPETYNALMSKLKRLEDTVNEKISESAPEKKSALERQFKELITELEQAHALVDEGSFNEATRKYAVLYTKLANLVTEVRDIEEEISTKQPTETDASKLMESAYQRMEEGKTSEAQKIYAQITSIYNALPFEYAEKRHELEKEIAKLNKDLSANIDRIRIRNIQEGSKKIEASLQHAKKALKNNKSREAEKLYLTAKSIFNSFPTGFLSEKRLLQQGLIGLYEDIAARNKELLAKNFEAYSGKLTVHLQNIESQIKAGSVQEAVKTYNLAKAAFEKLPTGFLNERLRMQDRLFSTYRKLVSAYTVNARESMTQTSEKVRTLLVSMQKELGNGNYRAAGKLYEQIQHSFKTLPAGFLKKKTLLQDEILKTYEQLVQVSGERLSKDTHFKISEIGKLLDESFSYVKQKRYGLAEELYSQISKLYKALPTGFLQSKAMIRGRLLSLYKDILMHSDMAAREELGQDSESRYHQILKLLLNTRHHIAKREFDLIEPTYQSMLSLYQELPVGFVQKRTKLWDEIQKTGEESKLYGKLHGLSTVMTPEKLRANMNEIYQLKQHIAKVAPEDHELISYAESKYAGYLQKLMIRKSKPVQPTMPSKVKAKPSLPTQIKPQPAIQPVAKKDPELVRAIPSPMPAAPVHEAKHVPISPDIVDYDEFVDLQNKINELKLRAKPQVEMPS